MPRVSKAKREKREAALRAGGEELQRWVGRLKEGSTRDVWPRVLGTFCLDVETSPTELVEMATEGTDRPGVVSKAIRNLFEDYERRVLARVKKGATEAF